MPPTRTADLGRRTFLTTTAVTVAGVGLAACGSGDAGGETAGGEPTPLGTVEELTRDAESNGGVIVREDLRAYVVVVPEVDRGPLAEAIGDPAVGTTLSETGLVALSERCPHQGCRVPRCDSSGWFECPCHGSRFTAVGELRRGPAERGMSYLPLDVVDGQVRLGAGRIDGLGEDVDVTGVEDPGDHCA